MSFNWEIYKELNPDLITVGLKTQQHFERHYMTHGKREGRNYNINQMYPDFNHNSYRNNYADIKCMNNNELELHWLRYGAKEGRKYVIDTFIETNIIGLYKVIDINEVINDTNYGYSNTNLKPGTAVVLRVKNECNTIYNCIKTIVDIIDQIVVVDNGSTDGTLELLKQIEKEHSNVILYEYKITIPNVGNEHAINVNNKSINTIATYYNWCLSKVNRYTVIKWDADFICVRKNLIDMIKNYNLNTRNDKFSIWFTGITVFYGKIFNLNSFYDEFRVYSRLHKVKWSNYTKWESILDYIKSCDKLYVNGSSHCVTLSNYNNFKNIIPVFIELKDYDDYKTSDIASDIRDYNDNMIINKYKSLHTQIDYYLPNALNTINFGIVNNDSESKIIENIYNYLNYIGINVKIINNDTVGITDLIYTPNSNKLQFSGNIISLSETDINILKNNLNNVYEFRKYLYKTLLGMFEFI
jgi:glycosyltransferase involved in cell wall biosynthesis